MRPTTDRFGAEMFKWFVGRLGAGEARAGRNGACERAAGRAVGGRGGTRRIRGFQARLRLQGGSRLAGPGLQGAPRPRAVSEFSCVPARKASSAGPGSGAARREESAQPSGRPALGSAAPARFGALLSESGRGGGSPGTLGRLNGCPVQSSSRRFSARFAYSRQSKAPWRGWGAAAGLA